MRNLSKTLLRICLALGLAGNAGADEKWVTGLPGDVDLQIGGLFKINTSGPSGRDPSLKISEEGTAFAITPDMLITARHVTRNATEFANRTANNKIHIPDRLVTYNFARDRTGDQFNRPFDVGSVTPAPIPTIDASRLNLGRDRAEPFRISVCEIEKGGTYYLLKLRDGRLEVPRAVPITADVEVYTGQGEVRQFTHRESGLDTPKPGDSGAPILDAKGHVVGLLTAIQDAEKVLYVTLARNFLELLPSQLDVECGDRVRKREVNDLDVKLAALLESTAQNFDALQKRVALLELDNKKLHDQLARAKLAANTTIRVLDRVDTQGALDELDPAIYDEIIANLRKKDPVIPTVRQMVEDLSAERWVFSVVPTDEGQSLFVSASYSREITHPAYADRMQFCLRPLKRTASQSEQDDLDDKNNIENRKFYSRTDRMNNGEEDMKCRFAKHSTPNPEAKGGAYGFVFDSTVPTSDEFPVWDGLYYGILFKDVDDPEDRDILHRFIFAANPDNRNAVPQCYLFDSSAGQTGGRPDTIATFVKAKPTEREATPKCSTY